MSRDAFPSDSVRRALGTAGAVAFVAIYSVLKRECTHEV